MKKTLPLLLMTGLLAACSATSSGDKASLDGEVFYLQRIALPPTAQVTVSLQDISLADAPAVDLAQQQLEPGRQVPLAFHLDYDRNQVKPGHTYAVNARIEDGGRLLFITTERHSVKLDGSDSQPLRVRVDPVR
ncbi:YbaY family lipoprotein [Pseudomonas sp. BGr12]|uniref:YbaY family lipoprotein n=1 Tax=Pseudomonas sp. BGr12 TaxID=2936269 RepID=UPI00255A0C4F|nr:YbaY family lipoprotein [Pseudomonas sp. BJa5]MDL2425542.1 YbaY family lipoprotein [Pseudomonas sp. BJa5]